MRHTHDILRERLLRDVIRKNETPLSLDQVREVQVDNEFVVMMDNRMLNGYYRYGPVMGYRDCPINFVGAILDRLEGFMKTGNTEHMVDIANWARIAFTYTDHPKKHFRCLDQGIEEKKNGR